MAVEKIAAEIKGGKTEVYDADLSSYFACTFTSTGRAKGAMF